MVLERLDRGLATSDFFHLFLFINERHLIYDVSDHLPILLEVKTCKGFKFKRKKALGMKRRGNDILISKM